MPTRAFSYERISRDDTGDAPSPENQLEINRRAMERDGCAFLGNETDRDLSGGDDSRPGLERLLSRVRSGDRIYISDWLRWGRGPAAFYYLILLERIGAEIHSSTEESDGPLIRDVKMALGGEHLRATSRAVRSRVEERRAKAQYIGGSCPLGYRWEGLGKVRAHLLGQPPVPYRRVIDPEAIRVPLEICQRFDGCGEAASIQTLAQSYQLPWRTVRGIIRSPVYAGGYVVAATIKPDLRKPRRLIPYRDRQVIWDAHEAVISRELWGRNQERMEQLLAGKRRFDGFARYALTGLLRCQCGEKMRIAISRKGRDLTYVCPNASCTHRHHVRVDGWTAKIVRLLLQELATTAMASKIHRQMLASYRTGRRDGILHAEITTLRATCRRLEAAIGRGIVTDTRGLEAELAKTQTSLRSAERLQDRRSKQGEAVPSRMEILASLRAWDQRITALADHPDIDSAARDLLHSLLREVRVVAPGMIELAVDCSRSTSTHEPSGICAELDPILITCTVAA